MLTTPWLLLVVCCKAASRSRPPTRGACACPAKTAVLFTAVLVAVTYTCALAAWVLFGCPEPELLRGEAAKANGRPWVWRFPGRYHGELVEVLWVIATPFRRA